MKNISTGLTLWLSMAVFSLSTVSSQAQEVSSELEWEVQVGAAVLGVNLPWRGQNTQTAMVPYIKASYGNWSFGVEHLVTYQQQVSENFSFSAGLNFRADGYDSKLSLFGGSDHQVFAGYKSPDMEVVATAGVQWGWFSLTGIQDISNKSDSTSASMALNLPIYDNERGIMVNATVSAHWYSEEYVNYNYGIAGRQVNDNIGRHFYQSEAATNYQLSIETIYMLNRRWMLIGMLSSTKLDDNIIDSPLIGNETQDSFTLAVEYQF